MGLWPVTHTTRGVARTAAHTRAERGVRCQEWGEGVPGADTYIHSSQETTKGKLRLGRVSYL